MAVKCPKCQSENPESATFCADCGTKLISLEGSEVTATLETPKEELTRGAIFANRYEIIEELGKGGMGRVYRVEDRKAKEELALKFLKPEISADKKTIERFSNELRLAHKISHRNVCRMFHLGEDKGIHYITMEYVAGEDLKSQLRRMGKVPVEKAVFIAHQIAEGLAEAHRLGVVHRDLKPNNVMIDKEGNARIMDFGIARSLEAKGITGAGVMIGTPEYMSPEQVEGKDIDKRSDIYSLGVILYEMVTGQVPFEGETTFSVAMKHKTEAPLPPKKLNPQLPDDINHLILRCMEKGPEQRYQSAEEFLSALSYIEKGLPTPERIIPKRKPTVSRKITVKLTPKKFIVPAIGIIAVIIISFLLWRFIPKKKVTPPLSGKPSLAILYFENNTGNEALNNWRDALPALLITDLQQSKYLHVLGGERIYEVLKKLNLIDSEKYSSSDLKRVAAEARVSHILNGNFITAGEKFIINISLIKADTAETIYSLKEEGLGEESITSSVDKLTRAVKSALNISGEQIANDIDKKIGAITSSSPDAYKYFVEGVKQLNSGGNRQAIDYMEKATEIDPNFAMAYRYIGVAYSNMGQRSEGKKYIKKAFELSDRLSDRERYQIQGNYYSLSDKTLDKSIEAYNKKLQLYPDDFLANNILGGIIYTRLEEWDKAIKLIDVRINSADVTWWAFYYIASPYAAKGMYDKAEELLKHCLDSVSKNFNICYTLASIYLCQGKYDLALIEIEKSTPSRDSSYLFRGDIYHCMGDYLSAEKEYSKAIGSSDSSVVYSGYISLSTLDLSKGRFKDAIDDLKNALEFAKQSDEISWEVHIHHLLTYIYTKSGNSEDALRENSVALTTAVNNDLSYINNDLSYIDILYFKALASIETKSFEEVQKIASELKKVIDEGLMKKRIRYYYNLMGLLELKRKNLAISIENLKRAKSLSPDQHTAEYENGTADQAIFINPLAFAYYNSGDFEKARIEYEEITKLTTGRLFYGDIYAKSFYMLGKIYEHQGDTAKAIENYEKFLTLWKDADPGIAEVEYARKRLVGLKN